VGNAKTGESRSIIASLRGLLIAAGSWLWNFVKVIALTAVCMLAAGVVLMAVAGSFGAFDSQRFQVASIGLLCAIAVSVAVALSMRAANRRRRALRLVSPPTASELGAEIFWFKPEHQAMLSTPDTARLRGGRILRGVAQCLEAQYFSDPEDGEHAQFELTFGNVFQDPDGVLRGEITTEIVYGEFPTAIKRDPEFVSRFPRKGERV
jgi:hypothetical protein